jgi:hypothetical protein
MGGPMQNITKRTHATDWLTLLCAFAALREGFRLWTRRDTNAKLPNEPNPADRRFQNSRFEIGQIGGPKIPNEANSPEIQSRKWVTDGMD